MANERPPRSHRKLSKRPKSETGSWNAAKHQRWSRLFAGALVAIVLLLAGAWFLVANQVDKVVGQTIADVNTPNRTLVCDDQSIVGFPFRMGLQCEGVTFANEEGGTRLVTGELRTAAQVYDLRRHIAELQSPVRLEMPTIFPIQFDWASLLSSVRLDANNQPFRTVVDGKEMQAAFVFDNAVNQNIGKLDRLFASLETADSDPAFGSTENLRAYLEATGIRPEGYAIPPLNLRTNVTIQRGAILMAGVPQWVEASADLRNPVRIENATITMGTSRIGLQGNLNVSLDGLVSGELRLEARNLEQGLEQLIDGLNPRLAALKTQLQQFTPALLGFARQVEGDPTLRRLPPILIRDGRITLGLIALGDIPPLIDPNS